MSNLWEKAQEERIGDTWLKIILLRPDIKDATGGNVQSAWDIQPRSCGARTRLLWVGLGVPPPTPTWGGMLQESVSYYRVAWWFIVFPGGALLVTTLAFNLFGDGVRDAFDPRSDRLLAKG